MSDEDCKDCGWDGGVHQRGCSRYAAPATPERPFRLPWTPEDVARRFHTAYEQLAPSFGYETRKESAVPWESVPEANRSLMIAVVRNVLIEQLSAALAADPQQREGA